MGTGRILNSGFPRNPIFGEMAEVSPGVQGEEGLMTKKTSPLKRVVAKTLDQGLGETCTIHALANALSQSLMDDHNIDVIPWECLGALKQLEVVEIVGGNHVDDFHGKTLRNMTDQNTGAYGTVQIDVTKMRKKGRKSGGRFVLVYDRTEGDPETKHCVYIQSSCSDTRMLSCINSWGPGEDENLSIHLDRPGNIIYCIRAKWIPFSQDQSSYNIGRHLPPRLNKTEVILLMTVLPVTFFGKVVPLNFRMRKTVEL